jgi:hypothetical protein
MHPSLFLCFYDMLKFFDNNGAGAPSSPNAIRAPPNDF